jgi:hypothetical protein
MASTISLRIVRRKRFPRGRTGKVSMLSELLVTTNTNCWDGKTEPEEAANASR